MGFSDVIHLHLEYLSQIYKGGTKESAEFGSGIQERFVASVVQEYGKSSTRVIQ